MPKSFWLVKSEPSVYAYARLAKEGRTVWDGIRNYTARNSLREMKEGDEVLYYHSGDERAVVGVAKVVKAAYPEKTKDEGDWVVVDLAPVRALPKAVPLADIKAEKSLAGIGLVRMGRLSVMPLEKAEFDRILALGK